ncbi:efflux RND transporter periplasmic adaptor subunit [Magnetospira sp. QH-2]|uniref:efflux RND transporter periplasmic adaptor subunit n=1 Tax=Magnetospira sp. (strain QH-2) TaxID=1288970 RepID=UPI0003E80D52|nr:efflux RND transporter periplasmic adaptor subunit [Magnetospira sp. QH-2]CCQ74307.1 Membrane-fusion protein,Efflux transporter, RND family, MFP subunit [Magnetospira sp. QH-2]
MKSSFVIAGALAVGVVAWIGSGLLSADEGTTPESEGSVEQASVAPETELFKVRVRESLAQDWHQTLSLFGHTEAERRVELKAETAGRVAGLERDKGEWVEQDEILIKLAMDDRRSRLGEAQALLNQRLLEHEAAQELAEKSFRSKTKVAEARASLEAARAAVTTARLDIARTSIKAPFAGIVEERPVELGTYLAIGDPVAVLVDLDPILVIGELPETQAATLSLGTSATASLADGRMVQGALSYLSSTANESTRTFRFEVEVPNPDGQLRAGLTARLSLETGQVRAHRISPALLTLSDAGQLGLRSVHDDGEVQFHPVKIVDDTPEGMWVTGLPDRVRLIIVGQEFVKAGQTVEAVPETGVGDGA